MQADDDRFEALRHYVADLAERMGLGEWTIEVWSSPPEEPDAEAEIEATYGRRHAVLKVCAEFFEHQPTRQRHSLVHELLHLHYEPAAAIVRHTLVKPLGQDAYDAIYESFRQQFEYATDHLATVIREFYPLPELSCTDDSLGRHGDDEAEGGGPTEPAEGPAGASSPSAAHAAS